MKVSFSVSACKGLSFTHELYRVLSELWTTSPRRTKPMAVKADVWSRLSPTLHGYVALMGFKPMIQEGCI